MAQEADVPPKDEYLEFPITLLSLQSQGHTDRHSSIPELFMGYIEALKQENGSVLSMISIHVGEYLKANVLDEDQNSVPKLHRNDNLVVDSLPLGIINDLCESMNKMVLHGFEKQCLHVYTTCRKEFMKESLSLWTFQLQFQELNMKDIDKTENLASWIKSLNLAARILFPNERKLCNLLFKDEGYRVYVRTQVCMELATSLLNTANAMTTWNHFIRNTLQDLIQEFESVLFSVSLRNNAAFLIRQRLNIFEALENPSLVPGGGLHPITIEVMHYIVYIYSFNFYIGRDCEVDQGLEVGKLLSPMHIAWMTELLESSLEANSKNYNLPVLSYFFIMNNRKFIELEAKMHGLGPIFGDDWLHNNTTQFQQNLELYLSSSWYKILEFLKVEMDESELNVVAELMKDKLYWFNQHFDEICNVQSEWSLCDEELRELIIKSIENILLPAYGNFIWRFQDFLGKHADEYIKYGMFDVLHRLNSMFLTREWKQKIRVHRSPQKKKEIIITDISFSWACLKKIRLCFVNILFDIILVCLFELYVIILCFGMFLLIILTGSI